MRQAGVDSGLKKLLFLYAVSGTLFLITLGGVIVLKKYGDSLSNTVNMLQTAKQNLVRIKESHKDIAETIAEVKSIVPKDAAARSSEESIFIGIDELKSRLKNAEVSVTSIEYKGDEVSLPVSIKVSAAGENYAAVVNVVGYLQSMSFPFFSTGGLSLSISQDKTAVLYDIKGTLKTFKTAEGWQ